MATEQPPSFERDDELEQLREELTSTSTMTRYTAARRMVVDTHLGLRLGRYEQRLRAHLGAGNPLPAGVLPPFKHRSDGKRPEFEQQKNGPRDA